METIIPIVAVIIAVLLTSLRSPGRYRLRILGVDLQISTKPTKRTKNKPRESP